MAPPASWRRRSRPRTVSSGSDSEQRLAAALRAIDDWTGRDVLDLGCGTGFHLPRFAASVRCVVGLEPHPAQAVDVGWSFGSQAGFESVVRIEFDRATAAAIVAEHEGTEVGYAVNLWWRHY